MERQKVSGIQRRKRTKEDKVVNADSGKKNKKLRDQTRQLQPPSPSLCLISLKLCGCPSFIFPLPSFHPMSHLSGFSQTQTTVDGIVYSRSGLMSIDRKTDRQAGRTDELAPVFPLTDMRKRGKRSTKTE